MLAVGAEQQESGLGDRRERLGRKPELGVKLCSVRDCCPYELRQFDSRNFRRCLWVEE